MALERRIILVSNSSADKRPYLKSEVLLDMDGNATYQAQSSGCSVVEPNTLATFQCLLRCFVGIKFGYGCIALPYRFLAHPHRCSSFLRFQSLERATLSGRWHFFRPFGAQSSTLHN